MKRLSMPITVFVALTSSFALANIPEMDAASSVADAPIASDGLPSRPVAVAVAPKDTVRLAFPNTARERVRDLDAWFAANPTQRVHVQTDRPLYRPGETVSLKVRSGPPSESADDGEDRDVWAGVVPMTTAWEPPESSPLTPGAIAVPVSVQRQCAVDAAAPSRASRTQ